MTLFADGLELLGGNKKLRRTKKGGKPGEEEEIDPAAHLPSLFRDIFRNAFLKFRDGRILTLFLTELGGFAYSHSEELGNAFEYILQCMGAQGDNGQFRTPRHVIDFMVACLDPQPTDRILDPACGTGGFLVSAFKHILAQHTSPGSAVPGDRLTHDQRRQLYRNFTGYDINDQMVKLSRVNLFLHQFATPAIHIYDTLTNDARWAETADLILANPPFMTPKGGVVTHTKFRVPAKKSEVLFTDYIAEHLSPEGRAGVIVPNGIVATTQQAYVKLRRFLVEDSLVAVVSLPAGCFKPYSGVKTSILFLDKRLARRTDQVLFLKIAADGFDLGDKRTPTPEKNDLPAAEQLLRAWLKGKELPSDEGRETSAAPLAWKHVAKSELLAHTNATLQAEVFFGDRAVSDAGELVALGEVASFCNGGTPAKSNPAFWQGDIPWVSPKDMKTLIITDTEDHVSPDAVESSATKLLPAGTVLCVVRSGILQHTLPVDITARPMCNNQDILAITPDTSRLDPKFLLFVLKGRSAEILREGIKTGVTVQSFHNGFFKTYEIPLPPLEEQRRIVAEIEGYQKVIDGARQILAAYKPRFAAMPEWEFVPLGDVLHFMRNGSDVEQRDELGRFRVSRIQSIADGTFNSEKTKWTDDTVAPDRLLQTGDILLSHINSVPHLAKTAIFRGCDEPVIHGINLLCLRPNREIVVPEFLAYWLKQDAFVAKAVTFAKRAVNQASITTADLKSIEIPLPPLAEQERIVAELDAEAAKLEAVRGLIPAFEAKIHRTLSRLWGTS
jgi:type I restriction enzyme M protein